MITPANLKTFCTEMQATIPNINYSEVVVDDSQLVVFLKALKTSENNVLMGIVPEYPLDGNQDNIKWKNQLMFMVLKKTNSRNTTHQDFLDNMTETLADAKQFVEILLSEKAGDNGDFCGVMNDIVENSVRIYPIWNKAECNGWGIDFDLLTNV